MGEEEKLLWMFTQVHGEIIGACYLEVEIADEFEIEETRVNVMKQGNLCWSASKVDLVFDYLTKHLDT